MSKWIVFIILAILIILSIMPIYWTFVTSISPQRDLIWTSKHWFPKEPTLEWYKEIFSSEFAYYSISYEFRVALVNSIIVAGLSTLITLILGSFAAYAVTRLRVPLGKAINLAVILTQMLPPVVLVIPLHILFNQLGWLNSKSALSLIYIAINLPFAIWILSSYFIRLPVSIEEAAIVDGCSYFKTLIRIVLPLSKPALFTAGIFVFLASWNEFLVALVLTSDLNAKTMPIAISEFMGRFNVNMPQMTAAGIITMVPPILFAVVFQKYLIEGLTQGAIKE